MRKYETLLFDLDGTLTDTRPGIMVCLEHTFRTLGIEAPDDTERFLGPPLQYSFSTFCGMNEEETDEAVRIFREKYRGGELFNAKPFDGIEEMLAALKAEGYTIAAATCKIEKYAKMVLERFGIAKYFDFIGGAEENIRTQKAEVISHVLKNLGVTDTSQVLMIGDRDNDIKGAAQLGIPCLYALWGYGSAEEAAQYGAAAVVTSPQECLKIIKNYEL